MQKIHIDDASRPQLLAFATIILGLPVAAQARLSEIRAKVEQAGFTDEYITVPDEAHQTNPETLAAKGIVHPSEGLSPGSGEQPKPDYVTVLVNPTDEHHGGISVPTGVNGTKVEIPRGVPCRIPYSHFEVLDGAKKWVYSPTEVDGLGERRSVQKYPHRVVSVG